MQNFYLKTEQIEAIKNIFYMDTCLKEMIFPSILTKNPVCFFPVPGLPFATLHYIINKYPP